MPEPSEIYDAKLADLIEEAASFKLETDEATKALKNLQIYSSLHIARPAPEPEPTPEPSEPETVVGKAKAGLVRVWDHETTRVAIKAGGAFAGVALVVYSTIHRDHVLDKQAMQQATQRNA